MLVPVLAVLASYLLGSIPFGLVMARVLKGVDLREVGSGNIGATNAMRVLGKPLGLVAFLLDFGKGLVPTLLLAPHAAPLDDVAPYLAAALCGTAAVVGHCFPVYLRFKGGKGVATGCGAIVGVDPMIFVLSGLVWVACLVTTRFVSLSSIAMGVAFPVVAALRVEGGGAFVVACGLLTLLVVVRHRANISRMLAGTEPRIGAKRQAAAEAAHAPNHD
ncbi:MAG: glycerol-3-phosphate 1-O-acyltransferase PlsY [Planctomycetota bacterium]|jgi:glycerol-3-phosphate acyltransferase PlsY